MNRFFFFFFVAILRTLVALMFIYPSYKSTVSKQSQYRHVNARSQKLIFILLFKYHHAEKIF